MTNEENHLESRIAKNEAAIEALTRDVSIAVRSIQDVSTSLQEFSRATSDQLKTLGIAVERASAPRRIDYTAAFTGVALVLAIGAAAFSPIMLHIGMNATDLKELKAEFSNHEKLPMHPVGLEKVEGVIVRLDLLDKKYEEVKINGSPITRERLAVLEERISRMDKSHAPPPPPHKP